MFARRYFCNRAFAPRYFPKVGAPVAAAGGPGARPPVLIVVPALRTLSGRLRLQPIVLRGRLTTVPPPVVLGGGVRVPLRVGSRGHALVRGGPVTVVGVVVLPIMAVRGLAEVQGGPVAIGGTVVLYELAAAALGGLLETDNRYPMAEKRWARGEPVPAEWLDAFEEALVLR